MKNNIEKRIKNVMSTVFEVPRNQINNESSTDTIEAWDSLKHMNLIIALEEEFKIQFTDEDTLQMLNYLLIKTIIIEKMV